MSCIYSLKLSPPDETEVKYWDTELSKTITIPPNMAINKHEQLITKDHVEYCYLKRQTLQSTLKAAQTSGRDIRKVRALIESNLGNLQ